MSQSIAPAHPPGPAGPIISLAKLVRLPNVFSAPPDVLAGYWLVAGTTLFSWGLCWTVAASCFLYAAGMVWNDLFDLEVDRRQRPGRPLPSGSIAVPFAVALASLLTAFGIGMAFSAGRSVGLGSILLAAAILTYDGVLKRTAAAPVVMGLCRMLNVMLGVILARESLPEPAHDWGTWVAIANGIYITGVTIFARREAGESPRSFLLAGFGLMELGIVSQWLIWTIAFRWSLWPAVLLGIFTIVLLTRQLGALADASPSIVQRGVKVAVLGIIVVNAATAGAFAGAGASLIVLAHLIPALWLGRWLYST